MRKLFAYLFISVISFQHFNANAQTDSTLRFSLDEAVAYAIENSFQSQAASLDVFRSKKQVWEATAIGLPQVNATADYNYNIKNLATPFPVDIIPESMRPEGLTSGDNVLLAFGSKQTLGASVTATQKILDGSYIVGLQSARTIAKISELAEQKTNVLVQEAVSLSYVTVLVGDEAVKILERNVENIQSNIKQISAMYENGFAEEQDVEQLELNFSTLNNSLERSRRLSKINREMLKFAMGMYDGQQLELSDNLDNILLSNYKITALNEALDLEDHIDYKISANQLKTGELLVKYEKTKYMPNISAFMNAGYNSYSEIFDFFDFQDDKWAPMAMVGVSLNIPVFSSFQRKARVGMATIDYKKNQLEHTEMIQRLFLNLQIAQDEFAFSIDNYMTSQKRLRLAENIEKKENIKYKEGVSTSLDLTNAQNQLYSQQDQYLNAISNVIQAKISLDKALDKF